MKKLQNSSGLSLLEMMAAILVLVLLVMGMDAGMRTGTYAYTQSIFESNSAALSGILNTALDDILRSSEDITVLSGPDAPDNVRFLFTSYEYGVRDGYFAPADANDGTGRSTLQIRSLQNADSAMDLVNTGAYPRLSIMNFAIDYVPPAPPGKSTAAGGYFRISYEIQDVRDADRCRSVEIVVRRLNNG